ncbi:AAA family ATPase [Actinoplanes sp. N902-109]|uniref:AAA family ATPase n=1 Tax=Actinoplanes sp. (strain N902-109) TaxID=649831 RepID=UPI0003293422|nr:LuxR family transcriptional regulator [Actinoplanes sp. N902-109]AGL16475.1 regulator of cholesterol oxidase [Actinoplanes sp. N902-109]
MKRNDLVARDGELRWMQEILSQASEGRGAVVTITGAIACGKTVLLDAAAASQDVIQLRAVCSAEEQELPYAMVGQLLDNPVLAARVPALGNLAAAGERLLPGTENRIRRELTRTLLALADERPVLIGVDDMHHADPASLDCLLHLARRVGPARIAIVLTELRRLTPAHSRFQSELLSLRYHHEIGLQPLTAEHTADLARVGLGAEVDDDVLTELYEATGGNPSLCCGLIRDVRQDWEAGVTGIHVGRAYRLAYLSSLYRCGPAALRTARAAAVLGDSADACLIRRVSGLGTEAVGQAIQQLTEGGLLRDQQFPHPAARSVVLDDMSAQERHAMYRSAREAAAEGQADPGTPGEPRAATAYAGCGEQAGDYPEPAGRACVDGAGPAEYCGDPHGADDDPDELVAALGGLLPSRLVAMKIRRLAVAGRPGAAAELLTSQRLHAVTSEDRASLRAAEVALATLWPGATGPDRHPLTEQEAASLPEGPRLLAAADDAVGAALRGRAEYAAAEAENVLRHADPAAGGDAYAAMIALLYTEHPENVLFWADKLDAGRPDEETSYPGLRAETAVRLGDLETAMELGRTVLDQRRLPSLGVAAGLLLGGAVTAAIRLGDLDRAEKWLAEPIPDAIRTSLYGLHVLAARGRLDLAAGRYEAAYTAFRLCGERMAGWDADVSGLALWRVDAAEALLSAGIRPDEGRKLIDDQLTREMGARSRALTLRAQAAYSLPVHRVGLLDEAAGLLLACHDGYERARVLADLGETLRTLRHTDAAQRVLRQAEQAAARCGSVPLLRRLGAEPVRIGTRRGEPGLPQRIRLLTDAERRVAAMAAAGQTNREIAGRLFVTASTVEQHLTSVFRKLGVKGRRFLPTELAQAV